MKKFSEWSDAVKIGLLIASVVLFVVGLGVGYWGFLKPYNQPVFEDVQNEETAFLVPLENDNGKEQVHFESVSYLKDRKVNSKRVQIPRYWVQRGYFPAVGEYLSAQRLIKVSRSTQTRRWLDPEDQGNEKGDAGPMTGQSKDGTGLSMSFTCSAMIPEESADNPHGTATFLYYYRGSDLAHVMDNEVRGRVQSQCSKFCAKFSMDLLRGHQEGLVQAVADDVVPFYAARGIQITNVGLKGGFHYTNKGIQAAIDKTVQDQQLRVSAEARRDAQEIQNKTTLLEAEGRALAAKADAEGVAAAAITAAEGTAKATRLQADADAYKVEQLGKNPDLLLRLRTVEIELKRVTTWNGQYPAWYMTGGNGAATPLVQVPAPVLSTGSPK